ncbi:MAG: hypothetical protein IKO35_03165 [Elusimicrobiaceae bacterium]|nr:hypothetical protein [Elusimicrobiaceae bacterium]
MRRVDINRRYRSCAIYCVTIGRKNDGRGHITWKALEERFGIGWESLTNELKVKGILHGTVGYMYLTPQWAAMTAAEQMEEIKKIYPYPYSEYVSKD